MLLVSITRFHQAFQVSVDRFADIPQDIAVAIGIVPEDQYRLGQEGAGIVRRVGKAASPYKVGDRVLVDRRGCFANRVQAPVEGVHLLPDSMSFEVRVPSKGAS